MIQSNKIRVEVGEQVWVAEYGDYTPISKVISFFQRMKKNGATHIEWVCISTDDDDDDFDGVTERIKAIAFYEREETEEDRQARLEEERAEIERREQMEREWYERLKKKFER